MLIGSQNNKNENNEKPESVHIKQVLEMLSWTDLNGFCCYGWINLLLFYFIFLTEELSIVFKMAVCIHYGNPTCFSKLLGCKAWFYYNTKGNFPRAHFSKCWPNLIPSFYSSPSLSLLVYRFMMVSWVEEWVSLCTIS